MPKEDTPPLSGDAVYRFDDVRIDCSTEQIWKGKVALHLEPKAYQLLCFMVANRGRLIEKQELLDAVWEDTFVTENAMTRIIAQLRKALNDEAKDAKYIETVVKRGYRFIADVEVDQEEAPTPAKKTERLRPYPGLSPFTEEDREYFFGREAEVDSVWGKLREHHLIAILGPSGVGKSSFLRAGLIPSMPGGWRCVFCHPGASPFVSLAQALAPELSGDTEAIRQLLRIEEVDVALPLFTRWRTGHTEALVIVDQFEELFTLNPPEVQSRFAALLGRLANEAGVHVLLSLRDDFLFSCQPYPQLEPMLAGLTLLAPPTGAELKRALVQPALKCGYRFEDDTLADEMIDEVAEARGALPLLAFAAAQLWERRDRDRRLVTREAYEAIGRVGGALARHAEATMERIGNERLPIVREIFRNLVTAERTRSAQDMEDLLSVFEERDVAKNVLVELVDARLLTSFEVKAAEGESSRHQVEIVHESLLSSWPRLVRWQTQDADSAQLRDQIRQAAALWQERGRPVDLLWTGASLKEFRVWREHYPGGLTDTEEAFVAAMVRQAERRRNRKRIAASAVMALLVLGLSVITALWRQSVADTRRAVASKLLALGQLKLEDYPTAAVAYALASLERSDTPEARRFALGALWRGPTAIILPTVQPRATAHLIDFSPDGKWFALSGHREAIQIWSSDGQMRKAFDAHQNEPLNTKVRFGKGDLLLSGAGKTIRFWSLPEIKELRTLEFENTTRFEPLGTELFTWTQAGGDPNKGEYPNVLRSWPIDGGEPVVLGTYDGLGAEISEGRWLTYFKDRTAYAVPVDELATASPSPVTHHDKRIRAIMVVPGKDQIVSRCEAGVIQIGSLDPHTTVPVRVLRGTEATGWVGLDHGGSLMAAAVGGRDLHLWDLAGPPEGQPLVLKRRDLDQFVNYEVRFHPGGQWLAVAQQNSVSFWPLSRRYSRVLQKREERFGSDLLFTPDGRWLASASRADVRLLPLSADAGTKSRVLVDKGLGLFSREMALDRNGRHIVMGGASGNLLLLPLEGGPPREVPTGFRRCSGVVVLGPQGRLAAVGTAGVPYEEKVIRVVDLESGAVQVLGPPPPEGHTSEKNKGATFGLEFMADGSLLSLGKYGLVRWNLEDGSSEALERGWFSERGDTLMALSPDRRHLLTNHGDTLEIYDLEEGGSRIVDSHGSDFKNGALAFDPTGQIIVTGDAAGVIRVGSLSGDEPHLLLGHEALILALAVSPDGRRLASVSADGTTRLWPMPDMDQPPFHTLPYEEMLERLRSLTNLRVVSDDDEPTGYRLDVAPFPGWEDVPVW
jgi:DNA-binding winged helix-turn-helix (wHTH) protein/WD40 repeat protein